MSAADAPGRTEPATELAAPSGQSGNGELRAEDGQEGGQEPHPGGSGDEAVSSRIRHRRLVSSVTALAVVAAVVIGLIVAFTGNSTTGNSTPAPAATGGGAAGPAVVANEAAATVAVVTTGGSISGGPLLGRDGQLWLVELNRATHQPMLAVVNPTTYAVSTRLLPASLGGLALQYTGAEAFDGVGQLWLGAKAAPAGQQPTGILVRYIPGSGATALFSLGGNCSDDSTAQPAQLFTASDGGVWVECASADSGATFIARLSRNGAFTQPYLLNYLNRALQGTRLWDDIADLPQAMIGPLVPAADGTMWGITTDGFVELTAAGAEQFTHAGPDATDLETQAADRAFNLQLVGNGLSPSVDGLGECRPAGARAGQGQECAVTVNSVGGKTVLAAVPDYDGHAGNTIVHPAGMDQSGDVWFIVDGKAGGKAPAGQYFFEVTAGAGTRLIPFSVPRDALPIPVVRAPVITPNGAVWTADPESGPGALVEVMPKN